MRHQEPPCFFSFIQTARKAPLLSRLSHSLVLSFPFWASPASLIYQAFLRLCSTPFIQEVLYPPLRVYLFFFSVCQSVKKINSIFTHFAALFPTHLDRLFCLPSVLHETTTTACHQRQSGGFNVLARVKHTSSAKVFWLPPPIQIESASPWL